MDMYGVNHKGDIKIQSVPTLPGFVSAAQDERRLIYCENTEKRYIGTSTEWKELVSAMVGDVKSVAYETVPTGWLECNGASLLRASYAELFTAIGTNYGTADGSHFNIPDLRGKFPRGWDHAAGNDPDRAARTAQATGGDTGDHVGTIQADGFKAHTHTFAVHAGGGSAGLNVSRIDSDTFEFTKTSSSTGGNETRPINVGVMFIIKY